MSQTEIEKARQFLTKVSQLASKYKLPIFAVTSGASITINRGSCDAVREARKNHIRRELKQGYNPFETGN